MNAVINKEELNFKVYASYIESSIVQAMEKEIITEIQALALLVQFTKARTVLELKETVERLISKFSFLESVLFNEKSAQKSEFDYVLQIIVSNLIKEGQIKESQELLKSAESKYKLDTQKLLSNYKKYSNI